MSTEPVPLMPESESSDCAGKSSAMLQMIGWFSAGLVVAAVSIYLGVELRSRYLFNRRTPYDFYSNVGDQPASEFGMGI